MDRSQFRLIQGGAAGKAEASEGEGPISRMDLWARTEPVSSKVIACLIFAKLALLASLLYFIWGK